eukprot:2398355-Prymnesium_polylepis.1
MVGEGGDRSSGIHLPSPRELDLRGRPRPTTPTNGSISHSPLQATNRAAIYLYYELAEETRSTRLAENTITLFKPSADPEGLGFALQAGSAPEKLTGTLPIPDAGAVVGT